MTKLLLPLAITSARIITDYDNTLDNKDKDKGLRPNGGGRDDLTIIDRIQGAGGRGRDKGRDYPFAFRSICH